MTPNFVHRQFGSVGFHATDFFVVQQSRHRISPDLNCDCVAASIRQADVVSASIVVLNCLS